MNLDVFWDKEVADAKDLVKASRGNDYAFVGVLRAKAIIAKDEEVKALRGLNFATATSSSGKDCAVVLSKE